MTTASLAARPPQELRRAAYLRFGLAWVFIPAIFMLTAGTVRWWQAWVYCAVLLLPMTPFVLWMMRKNPEFIERRMKLKEKEQTQRRIVLFASIAMLATFLMPGLDHRFGWSAVPVGLVIAADVVVLVSYVALLRIFAANPWAGRTVETRPGQEVISTGPYGIVRHPMYSATSCLYLATPLALGSWWGLIPAALYVPAIVFRLLNEEKVLLRELPGYDEYRRKVRYRLLPGVW